MNSSESNNKLKIKAATISLLIGLLMFLGKITAFVLTDSRAIFSDAAESVVHVLATSVALYSIILSSKPADYKHLYGHGNIEYFSAGMEGLLIILAAGVIFYSSITDLIVGASPHSLDTGTIIIAAAGAVNLALGFYLIRQGKKTNSLALIADGKHVLTDSYTSLGVIIGLLIVMFSGYTIFDPIAAMIVASNIVVTGYKLIRESFGGLMNETDTELLHKISGKLIQIRKDFWIDLHKLRFWTSADKVFVDFHLVIPYYFTIKESHTEEERIEKELNNISPNLQLKVHYDYCKPFLCSYCQYKNCEVRERDYSIETSWNIEKLTGKRNEE